MNRPKVQRRVGKYEVGKTIGQGSFAKVRYAKNTETGESVALKILDKEKVLKNKMSEQIRREISTMKLINHPNVVRLYEVLASKTKIYIVLEFGVGGELFDKIVHDGRLQEDAARKYFQQLINAVDYCHSRGVYHRDLKPENLLLDAQGNLKVSDFGLSALSRQVRGDGLLHTACGTPNYAAPEVLNDQGYDGATADLWSCGVILFVLLAGYLPFDESNLMTLYKKITAAEYTCPPWLSPGAKKLIVRILDPNPVTRISIQEILEDAWFKKNYKRPVFEEKEEANLDDVEAVFKDSEEHHVTEKKEEQPTSMNAFELISMSRALDLGNLFEEEEEGYKRETRFAATGAANELVQKIEEASKPLGFDIQKKNYKMRLENVNAGRKGNLKVATEIFQVSPSLHMVEVRKTKGDTLEFHKFYKKLSTTLNDVVWKSGESSAITDVDHYGRLGLPRNCSYDQVRIGYQDRVKELMGQGLEEEQLKNKMELIKDSYTILSSVEERRMYDWSLARSEKAERYIWPFEVDIMEPSREEPPPQEPEDVGPTRILGYFIGAWLVLGVALSVALNR